MKKYASLLCFFIILFIVFTTFYFSQATFNTQNLSDSFFFISLFFLAIGVGAIVFQSNMFQNHYRSTIERKDHLNHHSRLSYKQLQLRVPPVSRFFLEVGGLLLGVSLICLWVN